MKGSISTAQKGAAIYPNKYPKNGITPRRGTRIPTKRPLLRLLWRGRRTSSFICIFHTKKYHNCEFPSYFSASGFQRASSSHHPLTGSDWCLYNSKMEPHPCDSCPTALPDGSAAVWLLFLARGGWVGGSSTQAEDQDGSCGPPGPVRVSVSFLLLCSPTADVGSLND